MIGDLENTKRNKRLRLLTHVNYNADGTGIRYGLEKQ